MIATEPNAPALRCEMLKRLRWLPDRVLLDDLVFRLEEEESPNWELGDDCLRFYKTRKMIDYYHSFWSARPDFAVRNLMELGIWYGGSVAFWSEFFRPHKLVAVDLNESRENAYFRQYLESRGLTDLVKTYWGIDQSDRGSLTTIIEGEFDGPLDLVIDDASHLYAPTKSSFETLFPRMRTGGLFIIEDWAWEHWPEIFSPPHPFHNREGLGRFLGELAAVNGSRNDLIRGISICEVFIAIERGTGTIADAANFQLQDYIVQRPPDWSTQP